MDLYSDDFCRIVVNYEYDFAVCSDILMDWFIMTIAQAEFIVKKMKSDLKHGLHLLDLLRCKLDNIMTKADENYIRYKNEVFI